MPNALTAEDRSVLDQAAARLDALKTQLDDIRQDLEIDKRSANFLNWAIEDLENAQGNLQNFLEN